MKALIKKIKGKIRSDGVDFLLKFSLAVNQPMLSAFIISKNVNKFNDRGQFKVLCMRRSIFMDDVWAMSKSGRVHYLVTGRKEFRIIMNHFVGKQEIQKVTEKNYHVSDFGRDGTTPLYL